MNSRKSVRSSAVPVPCLSRLRLKLRVDDLFFHIDGEFSPPPSTWASRLDLALEAGIWALRLGFGPQGWDFAHMGWD